MRGERGYDLVHANLDTSAAFGGVRSVYVLFATLQDTPIAFGYMYIRHSAAARKVHEFRASDLEP